jgi:hypothetical protein
MTDFIEQKKRFLLLLFQTRKLLKNKQTISKWDLVIDKFLEMTPENLQERFRYNRLYIVERIIEKELDSFKVYKMINANDSRIKEVLKDIDRMLTDQMSSILAKIFLVNLLKTNKNINLSELHGFIIDRNFKSCLLHDLINL